MNDPHGESNVDEGAAPADAGTPQPPRRRVRALVVGAVAAALVIGGAAATVAILATRYRATPAAATAGTSAVSAPAQQTTVEPSPSALPDPDEFTFPERIGPLTNKTRPNMDDLKQSLTRAGVINPFAEKYQDASGRTVLLYGGNGRHSPYAGWDADQILDDVLQAAADPAKGRTAGTHREYPTGTAGGTLSCAPVKSLGTACGWKESERYVEAVLTGWQPDSGSALMRTVLDAIVLPG